MHKKLKNNQKWFWLGVILVELVLFISSSLTYKQQTTIPFMEKYLGSNNRPFYSFLKGTGFHYDGKYQSLGNDGYFNFLEFFIRKGAHFGIYFLLGLFICLALYSYFSNNWFLRIFIPWMSATGLAAFNEFHQGITGGRSPMIADVILDSFGSICAILIVLLIIYLISRHQKKRHPFSMEY